MAFQSKNLSVLAYANDCNTHYASVDPNTKVDTVGYFNDGADMLRVGDMIMANLNTDDAPKSASCLSIRFPGGWSTLPTAIRVRGRPLALQASPSLSRDRWSIRTSGQGENRRGLRSPSFFSVPIYKEVAMPVTGALDVIWWITVVEIPALAGCSGLFQTRTDTANQFDGLSRLVT